MVEALDLEAPLTASERLTLVALAEKADDKTRRVIRRRGEKIRVTLTRRVGVSDGTLTTIFTSLARKGLEVRVPLSVDRSGRIMFATPGLAGEYRIPALASAAQGYSQAAVSPDEDRALPDRSPDEDRANPDEDRALPPVSPDEDRTLVPLSLNTPSPHASPDVPTEHAGDVASLLAKHGSGLSERDAIDCVLYAVGRARTTVAAYLKSFPLQDIQECARKYRAGPGPKRATAAAEAGPHCSTCGKVERQCIAQPGPDPHPFSVRTAS